MLLPPDVEERIMRILAAVTSAFSVYSIGRELGQTVGRAIQSAVGTISSGQLTYLEQSFLAGKMASQIGTNRLRTMSEGEIVSWLRTANLELTVADQAILNQLRQDTERWLTGRSEAWQARIRTDLASADRAWRATLSTGSFADQSARSLARNSALTELMDRLRDQATQIRADVSRLVQSEMNNYFQQGQVSEYDRQEMVYKVPRLMACEHCIRVCTNFDGTPILYPLEEVMGNSNFGLPAYAWEFTIGPIHPYCYCILYSTLDEPPYDAGSGEAAGRRERRKELKKSLTKSNSCGVPADPELLFEDQPDRNKGHQHVDKLPPHHMAMIKAVKEIYGDKIK